MYSLHANLSMEERIESMTSVVESKPEYTPGWSGFCEIWLPLDPGAPIVGGDLPRVRNSSNISDVHLHR